MSKTRIKDLSATEYNGSYKIAVDDETNGTKSIDLSSIPDTNTTYSFSGGTNSFTVTPSGGSTQTVSITPSIDNNITGSGTSEYIAKFNGTNSITNGPQITDDTTNFLRHDGTWAVPASQPRSWTLLAETSSGETMTGTVELSQEWSNFREFAFVISWDNEGVYAMHTVDKELITITSKFCIYDGSSKGASGHFASGYTTGNKFFVVDGRSDLRIKKIYGR